MNSRLNIVPDPAFAGLTPALVERIGRIGASLHAAEFCALMDPLLCQTLQRGFTGAGAHEGTVWLVDEPGQNLEPVYNTGPDAAKFVGCFKQPLGSGLIGMVFASQQSFLENEVGHNAKQSKLLDSRLQTQTQAMIAVPLHLLSDCRGVISCVQLKRPGTPDLRLPGFMPEHLEDIQRVASVLAQLIEFRLLSLAVGWTMA